jgi:Yip1-like protein
MATTPAPAPAVEPQASISSFGRIAGVLFSPKPTFADIVRKPSWVAPLLVLLLTGLLLNLTLVNRVNWPEAFKEQIAKSKFASSRFDNLDDAAKEKAYAQGVTQAKVGRYIRGVIGWPLLLLLIAAIYFGTYRLIGGARVTFALSFVIVAFAHLPLALKEILGAVVAMLKDPSAIDPENYLASNPAALMPSDTPTWQVVPLAFLDVFGLWALLLVAVGFAAADPKKLPFGKSIGLAVGVNVCLMLFFTMIAWIFS